MPNYYTKRSDDELRKLAEQQYQSYYDQLRTAARQKQERESLALENQRSGIQTAYQKQRDESDRSYRQAYSQADRETLRRGMQRSSYAAQRLANVEQEGIRASQNIWDQQRAAEGNLDAQIAQISGQLADTLAGYDANQAADVLKRYNELQDEEYNRAREAEQYAESIRQWQTQFDESVRQFNLLHPEAGAAGGGGGGGWSGGGSGRGGSSKSDKSGGNVSKDLLDLLSKNPMDNPNVNANLTRTIGGYDKPTLTTPAKNNTPKNSSVIGSNGNSSQLLGGLSFAKKTTPLKRSNITKN